LKLFLALIIGGFLGIKLLANGINNGDVIQIILFFAICAVIGFVLAMIDNKLEL
jgi:phosphate/sulfate permease